MKNDGIFLFERAIFQPFFFPKKFQFGGFSLEWKEAEIPTFFPLRKRLDQGVSGCFFFFFFISGEKSRRKKKETKGKVEAQISRNNSI